MNPADVCGMADVPLLESAHTSSFTLVERLNLAVLAILVFVFGGAGGGTAANAGLTMWLAGLLVLTVMAPRALKDQPSADVVRLWLPLVVLVSVYESIGPVIAIAGAPPRDGWVILLERLTTGGVLPPLRPMAIAPIIVDLLSLAYAAYFILPIALLAALVRRHETVGAHHALLTLLVAFYLHYLIYLIVPVVGPLRASELPESLRIQLVSGGGWVTTHLRLLIRCLEGTPQDAFPSAHTSVTLLVAALARKHRLPLRWWVLAAALPIVASTVLLGYHYIVDVLAAVPVTWLAWRIGQTLSADDAARSPVSPFRAGSRISG